MKCIIFDLDGTLVDSEPLCIQALLDLLPNLNTSLDSLMGKYRGKKLANIFKDIELRLDESLPRDFELTYRAKVVELFDLHLLPIRGSSEALSLIRNPKCIASGGPMTKIEHSLKLTGLGRHFGENIFSSYEIQSWKPDPELFLHAAREMGFPTSECIVVEDSPVGLAAAAAAGMQSIHYSPDGESNSDHWISDMAELPKILKLSNFDH